MSELEFLLQLARDNAEHIEVINGELGQGFRELAAIEARVEIMTWFIGVNVAAWIGLLVNLIGKRLGNNKNNNK